VTRALVLELCDQMDIVVDTSPIGPSDLHGADEAFLTSSTREIQPISHIDETELRGPSGPMTRRLAEAFTALVARDLDP
jgi:branched-chain amino acid aminotransferase